MKRTITIKPDGTITIEESDHEPVPVVVWPTVPVTIPTSVPWPHYEPVWRVFPPFTPGTFTC